MRKSFFLNQVARILAIPPDIGLEYQKLAELPNWDSFTIMELVGFFQATLKITISAVDINNCDTISDLVKLAEEKLVKDES